MALVRTSSDMVLRDRTSTALHSLRTGSRMHQRGVSLATIMDLGGRHFGPTACEIDHDAVSFPTDKYDIFISHTWRTGRVAKYTALLYYTSLFPAVCAGLAAGILAFALQVQGILPPFGMVVFSESHEVPELAPASMWCMVMGGCTSFAILVMWARLLDLVECTKGTKVSYFFDRLCINQGDAELKQAGIDSIGAYLRNSDSILVLWSPQYFLRLWCVFELAVFLEKSTSAEFKRLLQKSYAEMRQASVGAMLDLRRNSFPIEMNNEETVLARIAVATSAHRTRHEIHDRKLMIIPVEMGVFCMASGVTSYVDLFLGRVMEFLYRDLVNPFWFLAAFGMCVAMCRFCRRYSQDRLELNKQIAKFSVSQADCNVPQDREFIKAVITSLYSETLSEIDGIAAFEHVLRSRVQQNVDKVLGSRLHVPWRLTIIHVFIQILHALDAVAETLLIPSHLGDSRAQDDRTARQAARSFAQVCFVPAVIYCAFVTSCFLPERKSKLAEFASNTMFVFVMSSFVCILLLVKSEMPTLVRVPLLNLIFGLILLILPACCNYVSCWISFRMHGSPSSNREVGQEASQAANKEPGEHESREETHRDEGDCEHVLEPREPQGATSMNIMAPWPEADGSSLTKTLDEMILGNVMARHGVADMTTGTVCSIHLV
ncbi:unnamed protein product [Polarella glacialis]|uniref:Uncharacterized protein n=1 Tax=Polarella glacialis TaxID=89957 RepID=A0A813LRD3_POLGL|nr:unnamed protein product [Polarella glacialis]CAE8594160.1 unnamed protein product [Polarella glacialis]CAE8730594.1 unnamed protein product [Polarella glacialis]